MGNKVSDDLAELLATKFDCTKKKDWFKRLPADTQTRLLVIREAYHEDKLSHLGNMRQLFEWCKAKYTLHIKFSAFRTWLVNEDA